MDEQAHLKSLLESARLMQVATVSNHKPWICTVYFVVDDEFNFYWLSIPERRHSREIVDNPHTAIAIAIKADLPVIGVQAEGRVAIENEQAKVKAIAAQYAQKYDGSAKGFYERFVSGINQHWVYKFTPSHLQLFDEVNFKSQPKRKII